MLSSTNPPEPDSTPNPTNDFDSPWKQALETYFEEFIAFFFSAIHADINWEHDYEFLDTYLPQIVRDAETGKQFADKIVKVWRRSGEESHVFVHIEIQSQRETQFAKRMYAYHYRLTDRFDGSVVSLAVLADLEPSWHPNTHSTDLWGCSLSFTFPTVKLLDYRQQWDVLEASTNPFATVVMAHLRTQDTQSDPALRRTTKLTMARALLQKGFDRQTVIDLLRFLDWLLVLPPALETSFWQDLIAFQEENRMPYLLSLERMAIDRGREEGLKTGQRLGEERGRQEGRQEGRLESLRSLLPLMLSQKLGSLPEVCGGTVAHLQVPQLEALALALLGFDAIADLESWLLGTVRSLFLTRWQEQLGELPPEVEALVQRVRLSVWGDWLKQPEDERVALETVEQLLGLLRGALETEKG